MTFKHVGLAGLGMSLVLVGCNQLPGSAGGAAQEAEEMAAAIESGEPLECVMTDPEGNSFTYKVMGEKMRMTGADMEGVAGEMISDGEYVYTWETDGNEGVKMAILDEPESADVSGADEMSEGESPDFYDEVEVAEYEDQGYDINCEPGNFGDDEFVPPSDVTFTDFGAQMDAMMQEMDETMEEFDMNMEQFEEVMNKMEQ